MDIQKGFYVVVLNEIEKRIYLKGYHDQNLSI